MEGCPSGLVGVGRWTFLNVGRGVKHVTEGRVYGVPSPRDTTREKMNPGRTGRTPSGGRNHALVGGVDKSPLDVGALGPETPTDSESLKDMTESVTRDVIADT